MPFRPKQHELPGHKASVAAEEAARNRAKSKFYTSRAWRRLREYHLSIEPLCRFCAADGLSVSATVVDHIATVHDRPDRKLDPSNLRSLCVFHHNQRTARDGA